MAKLQASRIFGNLTIDGLLLGANLSLNSIQVLTTGSGASYIGPTNLKVAIVIATGGGGGGGGADGDGGAGSGGGGGGAGATAIRVYTAFELTGFNLFDRAGATYTIGAGGAAGSGTNGTSGTAGGNTTFDPGFGFGLGPAITANGGALGEGGGVPLIGSSARGGLGGSGCGGGGNIDISGGDGGDGAGDDIGELGIGGVGGRSFWGGGGRGAKAQGSQSVAGVTATAYGGGGGGAACIDTTNGAAGGAGSPGVIFILEFT
jgi:hypothetical protein